MIRAAQLEAASTDSEVREAASADVVISVIRKNPRSSMICAAQEAASTDSEVHEPASADIGSYFVMQPRQ